MKEIARDDVAVDRRGAGWWDYAGCAVLAVAPVVSHMRSHAVDFLSIDAAGMILPWLGAGLIAGWLIQRSPSWVRILVLALLTTGFIDLQFAPERVVPFKLVILASLILAWLLREHYTRIAALSVGTMLVSGLFFGSAPEALSVWAAPDKGAGSPAASLVPVVHIIFDEHGAPRTFPADIPEDARARERVTDFYLRHRFRLFEKAYSRYFFTRSSIPATLSPLTPEEVRTGINTTADSRRFLVTDNALFRWASGLGYRIHVVQSNYLDACRHQPQLVASCRTYSSNSLASLFLLPIPAPRRIVLEHLYFLFVESYAMQKVGPSLVQRVDGAAAGTTLHELRLLQQRLAEGMTGSLTFAHLLFPHRPYELDRDCKGLPLRERLPQNTFPRRNSEAMRRLRWKVYAGQIECLYTHLDSLIATIDSLAPPQGVIIVFQGDHGSRIVHTAPIPEVADSGSDQDFLNGFATLLAVRGPGIAPGLDSSAVAIQDVVSRFIMGDSIPTTPRDSIPFVFLQRYAHWGDTPRRVVAPILAR